MLFSPAAMPFRPLLMPWTLLIGGGSRVFAVGQATSAAAREAGFVSIFTGLGGGAGLVPAILQHVPVRQGAHSRPAAVDRSFDMASRSLSMDMMSRRSTSMSLSRG